MERVSLLSLFSLLLLLSSLSGVELQDNNEATDQNKDGPEKVNVPEHLQPCLSDLHAALREMSAKVAVLQVQLEQVKVLSQEQDVKLTQVDTQQQAQANEMFTLKSEVISKVESLWRDREVKQVAFSASVVTADAQTIGPFNADTVLIFRNVISNIGNAYSPNTGFFTAPVKGAYHFELHIGGFGASHAAGAFLVKNGEYICWAYEHQTNGYAKASNGATLLLEAGDSVYVHLGKNYAVHDNTNRHSTFSGHLLFNM